MTSTPSTSLHVLPPQPNDIKPSLDHPPSPLTPRTSNSAMSSRAQLSDEGTYPTASQPSPALEYPTRTSISDMTGSPEPLGAAGHSHDPQTRAQSSRGTATGEATQLPMLGLKCTPPDVLPPSPPLTVADPRDDPELEVVNIASSSSAQPQGAVPAPSGMREEDITEWRASMHKDDEDEDGSQIGDGEYDPYDLGYSPDPTPITPVGPFAHSGAERANGESAFHGTPDHPLRFDVHPPSPPPWELIDPPDGRAHATTNGALQVPNRAPKPQSSRPLIPHSAYYFGPPPADSAYGTDPIGQLGVHHPREIIRIERDYSGGELVQFATSYPLELEGRITPTQFLETINAINERLIHAHDLHHSLLDNALAFFTLQLSRFVLTSHYDSQMRQLRELIEVLNKTVYNPAGLNILWPRKVGFMFLEIEYY